MNKISWHQIPLISALVRSAGIQADVQSLMVGMGSLRFSTSTEASKFSEPVAEIEFKDIDGILVSAALFFRSKWSTIRTKHVFKANFSKLKK